MRKPRLREVESVARLDRQRSKQEPKKGRCLTHTFPAEAAACMRGVPAGAVTQGGEGEGSADGEPPGMWEGPQAWRQAVPVPAQLLHEARVSPQPGVCRVWIPRLPMGPRVFCLGHTGLPCLLPWFTAYEIWRVRLSLLFFYYCFY